MNVDESHTVIQELPKQCRLDCITKDIVYQKKQLVNSSDKFNANLRSAKKHLNDIRVFFEENSMNLSAEVADDLRTLLEQVQQCIRLVGIEDTPKQ